ncbi:MAG: hypothetical protein HGA67_00830 [Candidatus Yonathbacteria bacterium]|nr:hypothetical protein [Candidatus Yonathbacteria bacterium]
MSPDVRTALIVFTRMSGWVAGPVLFGLFVGGAIDTQWHTSPYGLLAALGICFCISIFGIFREAKTLWSDIDKS